MREISGKISDSSVRRLSGYYRALGELAGEGTETVSSYGLASRAGSTPAQVRKDLSIFGHFGKRGTGYRVAPLRDELRSILGLNRRWNVVVVGAGNLAHALSSYREFRRQGFEIVAIFDNDPAKIGQTRDGMTILPMATFQDEARKHHFDVGVITTPASAAQDVADQMVRAGIGGILNFAPHPLSVPADVSVRNVNMAIEFESLSFALSMK